MWYLPLLNFNAVYLQHGNEGFSKQNDNRQWSARYANRNCDWLALHFHAFHWLRTAKFVPLQNYLPY